MRTNKIYLLLIVLPIACQKNIDAIDAVVYEQNKVTGYSGNLYTTKYGGLNYYVSENEQREKLFESNKVDSIIFNINNKKYVAKPIKRKNYSSERNNSDFSFFIDKSTNKIVADTVREMNTILLFSERTDMEVLKENGVIKSELVEKK